MSKYLMITAVKDGGQGQRLGLKPDDILKTYNGMRVSSRTALSTAAHEAEMRHRENVEIVITRGDSDIKFTAAVGLLGATFQEVNVDGTAASSTVSSTDYGIARAVGAVVVFVGWAIVGMGVVVLLIAFFAATQKGINAFVVGALPGVGLVVAGFLQIMAAQIMSATVDTADNTRRILEAIKDKV